MRTRRLLDHTGEVRLAVTGSTLAEVFAESALAFGELEAEAIPRTGGTRSDRVSVQAPDPAALLVEWLNELIWRAETGRWVPTEVEVVEASPTSLVATVSGPELTLPPTLVKAATLHGARCQESADGWRADVVLDV